MRSSVVFPISHSSQIGEARRTALSLVQGLSFDETELGRIAIVSTELSQNLVKHTKEGGKLIFNVFEREGTFSFEMLSVDSGRGMKNIGECLRDGFSTAGSPGTGLGAIQRLSTVFDIYSKWDSGTIVLSRVSSKPYLDKNESSPEDITLGVICVPNVGETICGDGWSVLTDSGRVLFLVADGLGHGPLAAEASLEAIRVLNERRKESLLQIVGETHLALKKTRGAAVSITELRWDTQSVSYLGVGNILGAIASPYSGVQRMLTLNGTLGLQHSRLNEFRYPWSKDAVLIMHSDGLVSHWKLEGYPGLLSKHPGVIAAVFHRDFKRGTDDVTVLVAKMKKTWV